MLNERALSILHDRVKAVHTVPRAGGAPYWTHPIRCHERLIQHWPEATLEAQIAMLFHDTIEDIEGGGRSFKAHWLISMICIRRLMVKKCLH